MVGLYQWILVLGIGSTLCQLGNLVEHYLVLVYSTIFEYTFSRDQEESTVERFREIIKEQASTMRDAVIEGFAIHPEDLKRVANPDLLDDIASNVMSLRLGDEQFARELYADIRDQTIRASERWHDVQVNVRLSSALERNTRGIPLFDVTVEWEYTTVPSSPTRRFVCTSDRAEYNELRDDIPATSTCFMAPRPGMDASSRDFYELLELTIDGEPQTIRRTARKNSQSYSVRLGATATSGEPVRVRQVFRTLTPAFGHLLNFELPQPARGMSLTLDYTNTSIANMRVSDTVATSRPARIIKTPESVPGRVISVEAPGWSLPKTGFSFTWTLNAELPQAEQRSEAV